MSLRIAQLLSKPSHVHFLLLCVLKRNSLTRHTHISIMGKFYGSIGPHTPEDCEERPGRNLEGTLGGEDKHVESMTMPCILLYLNVLC